MSKSGGLAKMDGRRELGRAAALLRERGIEPEIREYLKQPLTRAELAAPVKEMAVPARDRPLEREG